MKSIFVILITALSMPMAANAKLANVDSEYLTSAMQTQLGRYALASLAQKNSSSPQVKSLAKSIESKATAQTQTLTSIAKKNGVAIPTGPNARDTYHYGELAELHGSTFDQQFLQELRIDDAIVSSNDKTEMTGGRDPRIKSLAKAGYRSLQSEMQQIQKIHG